MHMWCVLKFFLCVGLASYTNWLWWPYMFCQTSPHMQLSSPRKLCGQLWLHLCFLYVVDKVCLHGTSTWKMLTFSWLKLISSTAYRWKRFEFQWSITTTLWRSTSTQIDFNCTIVLELFSIEWLPFRCLGGDLRTCYSPHRVEGVFYCIGQKLERYRLESVAHTIDDHIANSI